MSVPAIQLIRFMKDHRLRVFTSADIQTLTGLRPSAAVQALRRLARQQIIVRIKRSVWVNGLVQDLDPLEALPHLTAPWPSYVSLYTALSSAGVIEEVPQVLYGVSAGPTRQFRTSIGDFHVHHLPPHLIWGYEIQRIGQGGYPLAEPEKAFLDLVYLSLIPRSPIRFLHRRGKRWDLDMSKLKAYARRFHYKPLEIYLNSNVLLRPQPHPSHARRPEKAHSQTA